MGEGQLAMTMSTHLHIYMYWSDEEYNFYQPLNITIFLHPRILHSFFVYMSLLCRYRLLTSASNGHLLLAPSNPISHL